MNIIDTFINLFKNKLSTIIFNFTGIFSIITVCLFINLITLDLSHLKSLKYIKFINDNKDSIMYYNYQYLHITAIFLIISIIRVYMPYKISKNMIDFTDFSTLDISFTLIFIQSLVLMTNYILFKLNIVDFNLLAYNFFEYLENQKYGMLSTLTYILSLALFLFIIISTFFSRERISQSQ